MQTPKSGYSFLVINDILKTNIPLEGDLQLIMFYRFSAPKPLGSLFSCFFLKKLLFSLNKKSKCLFLFSSINLLNGNVPQLCCCKEGRTPTL